MKRIKEKEKRKDKVELPRQVPLEHIVFSLRYLTSNKAYSMDYFGNDLRGSLTAHEALLERMQELCRVDMMTAKLRGKISGSEQIPYKSLSQPMQGICDGTEIISKDSQLTVFRFWQNKYRMLCKTDMNHGNLVHIIAFDFDYSAYDHG